MKVIAKAKINLTLDILKKRADGYHELQTIMKEVDNLYDTLFFDINERSSDEKINNIFITTNNNNLPTDENNLCFKAIKYFKTNFNIDDDIHLYIEKNIPTSAGLGGGSSDFYSTIKFLNDYYKLKLSREELNNIANTYGSDMAFFSHGGCCFCEGRGEIITPLNNIPLNIKITTPDIFISTKKIYELYDETCRGEQNFRRGEQCEPALHDACRGEQIFRRGEQCEPAQCRGEQCEPALHDACRGEQCEPALHDACRGEQCEPATSNTTKTQNAITAINTTNYALLFSNAFNVLEEITIKQSPIILNYKNKLKTDGAKFAMMSGSGPSVFGIF